MPAGIPGFVTAACLGCTRTVEEETAFLTIAGLRDGSWLIETDSAMNLGRLRAFGPVPAGIELLGVAHRGCGDRARMKIEHGFVTFPETLPQAFVD